MVTSEKRLPVERMRFGQAVLCLLREREMEISALGKTSGLGREIDKLLDDSQPPPSRGVIEIVARSLGEPPRLFLDYRLSLVRSLLSRQPDVADVMFLQALPERERAHVDAASLDGRPMSFTLRDQLADLEMTQGELAESLGYPQNEFSRMLNAQTTPPADFIESLADALGIPPQTFLDYRLMVVEDALRAVPERVDELLEELSRGIELPPYFEWKVRPLADPRTMSLTDVAREIIEIVEAEGPVVGARVYRLRLAAAGIASETKELRSVLNRAAAAAVRSGRLLADNERDERTQKYLVLRAAGVEQVTPRARGDRSMLEVPLREIAEVVGMTNAHRRGGNVAEIQHEIFAAFGIAGSNIQILERVNTAIMWRKRG